MGVFYEPVLMIVPNEYRLFCISIIPDFQRTIIAARGEVAVFIGVAIQIANRLCVCLLNAPGVMVRITNVVRPNAAIDQSDELIALMVFRPFASREFWCIFRIDFGHDPSLRWSPFMQQDFLIQYGGQKIRVWCVEFASLYVVAIRVDVQQFGRFEIEKLLVLGGLSEIGQFIQGRLHNHLRVSHRTETG